MARNVTIRNGLRFGRVSEPYGPWPKLRMQPAESTTTPESLVPRAAVAPKTLGHGTKVTASALVRFDPLPQAPPASRYQHWKLQVFPGSMLTGKFPAA